MYKFTKQKLGNLAENLALNYLIDKGYKLLAKNFSCKYGEIDLVMQLDNIIIFAEVRCKATNSLYTPLESITKSKTAKIKKTANMFLLKNSTLSDSLFRFDIVSINHSVHTDKFKIDWIPDAFY